MKKLEAIVRVNKIEDVKNALEELAIGGMTVESVRGYGRQYGRHDKYTGSTYAVNLLPKSRIWVVVRDEDLGPAIEAIIRENQSGEIGDGKIFVSEVIDAIRIRTGERGEAAIS